MNNIKDILNTVVCGDSKSVLKTIPSNSIDMIATSPPYFGLRNYGNYECIWDNENGCTHEFQTEETKHDNLRYRGHNSTVGNNKNPKVFGGTVKTESSFCVKCGAWRGSLGMEPTFQLFIDHLIMIFKECRRVLKPTGTMFVNLGDSYNGSGNGNTSNTEAEWIKKTKNTNKIQGNNGTKKSNTLQSKSLMNIPSRFAIRMTDELKLIHRNTIIWEKANCMPESQKDRFTRSWEFVYFFTKEKKYYFEQLFEKHSPVSMQRYNYGINQTIVKERSVNVQNMSAEDFKDRFCSPNGAIKRDVWKVPTANSGEQHYASYPPKLISPMVQSGCPKEGIVLDPFMGSGTTGIVALQMGRNFIGIEISEEYCKMAEKRIKPYLENFKVRLF